MKSGKTLTAGLLGCGNIGGIIAHRKPPVRFTAVYDLLSERCRPAAEKLGAKVSADFEEFVGGDFDIVVEAASIHAVRTHAETILAAGKDLIALSVGAFADPGFRERIATRARRSGKRIRIPSGALFGLDNIKVGRISRLDKLLLRTTKPPQSLNIQASERTLMFRGSATECIQCYPKNVNVAVALSLAAQTEAIVELV